jgi:hypothetical protein
MCVNLAFPKIVGLISAPFIGLLLEFHKFQLVRKYNKTGLRSYGLGMGQQINSKQFHLTKSREWEAPIC